jgi:hypothetical protein
MHVMVQFAHDPATGNPRIEDVADRFGIPVDDFDADYGVVLVDEGAGLWVALLDEASAAAVQAALSEDDVARGEGVFANPVIEPYDEG